MIGRKKTAVKRLFTAGAVLFALAVAAVIALCFKGRYLLLRNEISGKVVFCSGTEENGQFSVSYVHSVNKSPVSEHYEIRGSEIFLTELRYSAFGAGMPTELTDGQSFRYEDGEMVIYGFERKIPYLCYNISRVAGHNLNLSEESIPLSSLDEPGQPVLFSAIVYPRLLVLLGIFPS